MTIKNFRTGLAAALMAVATLASSMSVSAASISLGSVDAGTHNVPVTVNYGGTAARAMIPQSITLTSKSGDYKVVAYAPADEVGDLDTDLSIVPCSSFTLTKEGSSSTVTATVSQAKTVFTPADINAGSSATLNSSDGGSVAVKKAEATGTITAAGLTSGTWKGTMTFTVQ